MLSEAELDEQWSAIASTFKRDPLRIDSDGKSQPERWAEFLGSYRWHWFVNLTFADRKHPEAADKAYRVWCSKLNRELYGVRWYKNPLGGVVWARGLEWQKRDVVHFHAVVASRGDLNREARRLSWMDVWDKQMGCGFARIYRPRSQDDVLAYVSKYVAKGGEVDFSRNFGMIAQHSRPGRGEGRQVAADFPSACNNRDRATLQGNGCGSRGQVSAAGCNG